MPFDPSGVFTRPSNSFSNPVAGTIIDEGDADTLFDAYDAALTQSRPQEPVSVTGATATVAATTSVIAIERAAPATTAITLGPVAARLGLPLIIADWSTAVTAHVIRHRRAMRCRASFHRLAAFHSRRSKAAKPSGGADNVHRCRAFGLGRGRPCSAVALSACDAVQRRPLQRPRPGGQGTVSLSDPQTPACEPAEVAGWSDASRAPRHQQRLQSRCAHIARGRAAPRGRPSPAAWCGWWLGQHLGMPLRKLWLARNWASVGSSAAARGSAQSWSGRITSESSRAGTATNGS
jgi:hypothetical protein